MEINYIQVNQLIEALNSIKDMKMPFKLGLCLARNLKILQEEQELYYEQERKFAQEYLVFDENGQLQQAEGGFRIQPGKEKACAEARKELDSLVLNTDKITKIKSSELESLDLTLAQVEALLPLIDEE